MHGEMSYMEGNFDKRLDPRKLLPGTRSVVSLLFNYHNPDRAKDSEAPRIAQYAYGEDYHFVLKWKLKELLKWMRAEWGDVGGSHTRVTATVSARVAFKVSCQFLTGTTCISVAASSCGMEHCCSPLRHSTRPSAFPTNSMLRHASGW